MCVIASAGSILTQHGARAAWADGLGLGGSPSLPHCAEAESADIDLDAAEWRYTVTKTNTPDIVPLSRQAVAILRELQPLTADATFSPVPGALARLSGFGVLRTLSY